MSMLVIIGIIVLVILVLVGGYFGLAWYKKWWPFKKSSEPVIVEPPVEPVSGRTFQRLDDVNLMYGVVAQDNPDVENYGKFESQDSCENQCSSDDNCKAYTWINDKVDQEYYKNRCYGMLTGDFKQTTQENHFTGIIE